MRPDEIRSMSIETDTDGTDHAVETLAQSRGDAIADLPAYREFLAAKAAVEENEQAQKRIAEFESAREEFFEARQRGDATNEDLMILQEKQERLHDVPVMNEFLRAQTSLERRLQALNEHVSDPLEIDFGEKAGGCCHD